MVWTVGLILGFASSNGRPWAVRAALFSSGLPERRRHRSTLVHVIALFEAAIAIGVLFIVIGYLPAVYGSFSRREIAVSQLATRAGSPPAAGVILHRVADRERWLELERDLRDWEAWAADLMETHLSYPILGWYRSQHVSQNWLAALTAMTDVAAFVTAVESDGEVEAAELTYAIGQHALADLAVQYRVKPEPVDRLPDEQFVKLYGLVRPALSNPVPCDDAKMRLRELRRAYEAKAAAISRLLAVDLPPWLPPHAEEQDIVRLPGVRVGARPRPSGVARPPGRRRSARRRPVAVRSQRPRA
jgi:hypothetical protein